MQPSTCDVCIIGAGPAGLSAARSLLMDGASVTIVDRHKVPGTKVCGGGLTGGSLALAPPGLRVAHSSFTGLTVISPRGRFQTNGDGVIMKVIDRVAWQGDLLEEVRDLGGTVILGRRFLKHSDHHVHLEGMSLGCGHLIGADGAGSRVRRSLGLEAGEQLIAWQTEVTGNTDVRRSHGHTATVRFDPSLLGTGYGWIFPTPGQLRVGCGGPARDQRGNSLIKFYKTALLTWLESLGLRSPDLTLRAAFIPTGYMGHRFARTSLVGDAAGLASPITGEGISQALICGQEVAREIRDPSYRSAVIPKLGGAHRRVARMMTGSPRIGSRLLALSPLLLRIVPLKAAALAKFT